MTLRSCTLTFEQLEDRTLPSASAGVDVPFPPPSTGTAEIVSTPPPIGNTGDWNPVQPPWAGQHMAVAVGDLSQDGQDNLVYGNELLNQVTLDFSTTNPNFKQEVLAQKIDPRTIQLADLTGNGRLDLVVADSASNQILIYLNLGNGQFAPAQSFAMGSNPVGVTIADLNGDGIPDIVVANQGSNTVSLFFGQQTKAGWALISGPHLPVGAGPVFTFVQDVTGNGVPDLFVADSLSNDVYELQGLGGGAFDVAHPIVYPVGLSPQLVFVGHFHDDAALDLVSVNAGSDDLTFFATPTFNSAPAPGRSIPLPLGFEPDAAIMHHHNDDNGDDLAVASYASGSVNILVPTSDGPVVAETLLLPSQVHPTDMALSSDGSSLFVAGIGAETPVVQLDLPGNLAPGGQDGFNPPVLEGLSGPGFLALASGSPQTNGDVNLDVSEPPASLLTLSDSHLAIVATSAITGAPDGMLSRPGQDCPCFLTGLGCSEDPAEDPGHESLTAPVDLGWFRFTSGQEEMLLRQRTEARERLREPDPVTDPAESERSALDRFFSRCLCIPASEHSQVNELWRRSLSDLASWLHSYGTSVPPNSRTPDAAPAGDESPPLLDPGPLPLLESRREEEEQPAPSTWQQSPGMVFSILTLATGLATTPWLKRRFGSWDLKPTK